jgi:hypothetical protein
MEYTWENIVAYQVWECKICHEVPDEDIFKHLNKKHGIISASFFDDAVYSDQFKYPNIIKG